MATLQFTKQDAKNAVHRFETIKKRIANIKERAEHTTERLVATAEIGGAAFAMGVLQGKTGGVEVFGVPLELGLGIGLNAFGLMGGAGKHSDHLVNVANGCLASYAATLGRGVGATWKAKDAAPKQVAASGVGSPFAAAMSPEFAGIPR